MATLTKATTTVSAEAGPGGAGEDLLSLIAPVPQNSDVMPRQFGSAKALYDFHGYCEAVEYAALHFEEARLPILFVGIPIEIPGVIGNQDTTGKSGTSNTTVTAGSGGALGEHDGVVTVIAGGTVGTDPIVLGISLDGGRTTKRVRLGTNTSYTIPYHNVTISFTVGTLITGETIHTWHASQPLGDSDGLALVRASLAAQPRQSRSWLIIGDLQDADDATAVVTQANSYETANERFIVARAQVRDRLPYAAMSAQTVAMSTSGAVTFETDDDSITRTSGSFVTDGFIVGDLITVAGSAQAGNNATFTVDGVTALALTVAENLTDSTDATGVSITGQGGLLFANSGDTITRNRGSWVDDGFRVGQTAVVSGTDSATNDGSFVIATLTPAVMTLASGGVDADESSGMTQVTITAGQQKAAWVAAMEAEFDGIDSEFRIDMGLGRGRKLSPFSGYMYRRPVAWAASIREYQHDLQVATWKKDEGSLSGWTLEDADGNLVEYDDRVDGAAASAARFTSFRTWANGPGGAFISLSLTRAEDGSILGYTHNAHVVNLAQTTVQRSTELIIGSSLELNADGTATLDSLTTIKQRVNSDLQRALLQDLRGEGARASGATWSPNEDDDLSGVGATLTGVLELILNGTVHSVNTVVKVS